MQITDLSTMEKIGTFPNMYVYRLHTSNMPGRLEATLFLPFATSPGLETHAMPTLEHEPQDTSELTSRQREI